jgi:hypothetical protein
MLSVTKHLCHDVLSGADPCIEIASPDFPSHILTLPLLATTLIAPDYFTKAPKSVINLGTTIANAATVISSISSTEREVRCFTDRQTGWYHVIP